MIIQSLASNGWWGTLGILLGLGVIAICASGLFERKVIVVRVDQYLSPEERVQMDR